MKTGEGRSKAPVRIRHVDETRCPKREDGGNHFLSAREVDSYVGVACIHCNVGWAELDAALNGASRG
jgi:hypothetical protein